MRSWASFLDFKNGLKEFEQWLSDIEINTVGGFQTFQKRHPVADGTLQVGIKFLPPGFREVAHAMYDKFSGSKVDAVKEIYLCMKNLENLSEENYNMIAMRLDNINVNMAKEDTLLIIKDVLLSQGNELEKKLKILDRMENKLDDIKNDTTILKTRMENIEKAIQEYAAEHNGKSNEINKNYKAISEQAARYIQDLNDADIILGDIPYSDDPIIMEGNMFLKSGDFNRAKECYENKLLTCEKKTLENVQEHIQTLLNLGTAFFQMGKLDEALKQFNKVVSLDKENDKAKVQIGLQMFLLTIEKKKEMLESLNTYYQDALKKNEQNALAYYFLAANTSWKGDDEKTTSLLKSAFNYNPKLKELFVKVDSQQGKPFENIKNDERIINLLKLPISYRDRY